MEIKWVNGKVLISKEVESIKELVQYCVENRISLRNTVLNNLDLGGMDLRSADLQGADLRGSNLSHTNLAYSNLSYSDLRGANLSKSGLRNAYLEYTSLEGADLRGADLIGATIEGAYLEGVNLQGVRWDSFTTFMTLQCPSEGSFIGFSKVGNHLITLQILEDSKRLSSTNRECRCDKAKVLEIINYETSEKVESVKECSKEGLVYEVGKIVVSKDFDNDRWDNTTGIHFYITKQEIEKFFIPSLGDLDYYFDYGD